MWIVCAKISNINHTALYLFDYYLIAWILTIIIAEKFFKNIIQVRKGTQYLTDCD